jgi:ABC-type multidrug transport system ATPase subunit
MSSITASNLVKVFPQKNPGKGIKALAGLSFVCEPGFVYGLIGQNGSGKSTCLRVLAGILRPTTGSVKIAGLSWNSNMIELRKKVGYLSASAQPYNRMTVHEFLAFCAAPACVETTDDSHVDRLIAEMGIADFRDRLCGELSTGMRQRVALAKALLYDPEILILDEPMTGLDIIARSAMFDLVSSLKRSGRTIILATHVPDEAERLCDQFLIINRGQLVQEGTADTLMKATAASNFENALLRSIKAHDIS